MKMNHLQAPKKQTQTKPISTTPKGVKQKSDAGAQRSDIWLLPSVFCLLSMGRKPKNSRFVYWKSLQKGLTLAAD